MRVRGTSLVVVAVNWYGEVIGTRRKCGDSYRKLN